MIVQCPHNGCEQFLDVAEQHVGAAVICPTCENSITIPNPEDQSTLRFADDDPTDPAFAKTPPVPQPSALLDYLLSQGLTPSIDIGRVISEESVAQGNLEERYDLGDEIARGGMGKILSAVDVNIRREVAMKRLLSHQSGGDGTDILRFIEEAQVTGQLQHPSIVPVHELGVDSKGLVYYTMKRIEGETLRDVLVRIREGDGETIQKWSLNQLIRAFIPICDALDYAHSKRVIHRDLKPENIMVGEFGEVLVVDWGIAKILGDDAHELGTDTSVARVTAIRNELDLISLCTLQGTIAGTPQYMAPEQAAGEIDQIDAQTDVFALGAILFEILALRPPYLGKNVYEVLDQAQQALVPDLQAIRSKAGSDPHWPERRHCPSGNIPPPLAAIAMKAMSRRKSQRYTSARELRTDIESYLNGFSTQAENAGFFRELKLFATRNKAAVIGVVAVLMALIGGIAATTWQKENTQKALSDATILLADQANRNGNTIETRRLLQSVQEKYRDYQWQYLQTVSKTSDYFSSMQVDDAVAVPSEPDTFLLNIDRRIIKKNFVTGEVAEVIKQVKRSRFITLSPDENTLVIANGSFIYVYSMETGAIASEWQTDYLFGSRLEFHPNGRWLIGYAGNRAIILDYQKQKVIWYSKDHTNMDIRLVKFLPYHNLVSIMGWGGQHGLLDLQTWELHLSKSDQKFSLTNRCSFSSGSGKLASVCNSSERVVIFDLFDNTSNQTSRSLISGQVDGRTTLCHYDDTSFLILIPRKDAPPQIERRSYLRGDIEEFIPTSLSLGSNPMILVKHPLSNSILATASASTEWWRAKSQPYLTLVPGFQRGNPVLLQWSDWYYHKYQLKRFSAPEEKIAVRGWLKTQVYSPLPHQLFGYNDAPQIISFDGKNINTIPTKHPKYNIQSHRSISPDARKVAGITQGVRTRLVVYATGSAEETKIQPAEKWDAYTYQWYPDSQNIVLSGRDHSNENPQSGFLLKTSASDGRNLVNRTFPGSIYALAFSPDGKELAATTNDGELLFLDPETLQTRRQFRVHDDAVTCVAWFPKQPIVATGAADHRVRFWNTETGDLIYSRSDQGRPLEQLSFSETGDWFCASDHAESKFWKVRHSQKTPSIEPVSQRPLEVDVPKAVRYVRIERGDAISLDEVEVYQGAINIAKFGTATQSSVNYGGIPENAIDGDTNPFYGKDSQILTKGGPSWWELELKNDAAVDRVAVWNRQDSVDRLGGFTLQLLDSERRVIFAQKEIPAPQGSIHFEFKNQQVREFSWYQKYPGSGMREFIYLPLPEAKN